MKRRRRGARPQVLDTWPGVPRLASLLAVASSAAAHCYSRAWRVGEWEGDHAHDLSMGRRVDVGTLAEGGDGLVPAPVWETHMSHLLGRWGTHAGMSGCGMMILADVK